MFEEPANPFEAIMDDSGNLPGDDAFVPEEADQALDGEQAVDEAADALEEGMDDVEDGEDESTDEEAEEESDEEETEDESEEEEKPEEDDAEKLFDIEIDGEVYEVNLPELQAGYLRNEELVKRTTQIESEHAERVAALEVKEAELLQEIEAYAIQGIADLRQYDNINWAELKAQDPEGFNAKRLEYLDRREAVQFQVNRRGQIQQMQAKAAEIKHAAYLESQKAIITKLLPDFPKPEFQASLVKFAEGVGISEDQVRSIADAKQLLILDMARKYSESQLKRKEGLKKKTEQKLPEVIKSEGRKATGDAASKRSKAARSNLREEQTINAAAAAFLDFV